MADTTNAILLSFDAEEFDLPLEHGQAIDESQQLSIGGDGLARVLDMLDERNAVATFFVTATLAHAHRPLIQRLVKRHELASHGLNHRPPTIDQLRPAKDALEQIAGLEVLGFRPARLAQLPAAAIRDAGFLYHSSENPTWIPGRYNNFFRPRTPHLEHGILAIPASVTPLVRFPLFWLTFKNAPRWLTRLATRAVLARDGHAALYFHPWEYCDLKGWHLPRTIAGNCGQHLTTQMHDHLAWLANRATFHRYDDFAKAFGR